MLRKLHLWGCSDFHPFFLRIFDWQNTLPWAPHKEAIRFMFIWCLKLIFFLENRNSIDENIIHAIAPVRSSHPCLATDLQYISDTIHLTISEIHTTQTGIRTKVLSMRMNGCLSTELYNRKIISVCVYLWHNIKIRSRTPATQRSAQHSELTLHDCKRGLHGGEPPGEARVMVAKATTRRTVDLKNCMAECVESKLKLINWRIGMKLPWSLYFFQLAGGIFISVIVANCGARLMNIMSCYYQLFLER